MGRFSRRSVNSTIVGFIMYPFRAAEAVVATGGSTMQHVVLLGDSVFDNAAYIAGGPDVLQQVKERLPENWNATLNAVDGHVTADVAAQLRRLPASPSHLVVSVGGNDALRRSGLLAEPARSVSDALARVADARDAFDKDYRVMLDRVLRIGLPTAVCTIYDPRFPHDFQRRVATLALAAFNDVISRAAFSHGAALIDLRLICSEDADFANPIEPSVTGGNKIATAVASFALSTLDRSRSEVFTR